ncbi:MAG: UDP-N-acetylglucosamine 2-epimerase (non-hydrolyzing) [Peptococcaceae bacterium]|jgi:UDP-N-acetylglucosamine 2-epimerase (non-hydrolysing)|nr:UDP-N-acetylglucosamine 2-epimerase (non-hydrolyzing) [Peptococcaceae bacterium]
MYKLLVVFGTRPEAIKMAPLIGGLARYPEEFDIRVAVTAQHREMLDQVLRLFRIKPDYDLDIMQPGQDLFDITVHALRGLQGILSGESWDLVLVHGDTTTTLVAALAAYYRQVPVGHVEAGLRTFRKYSPFPEEINRHVVGVVADLHFAPTATSKANLLAEGVAPANIFVTGNTVIDALKATVDPAWSFAGGPLGQIDFAAKRVLLVTTHRRENLGEPMREIYRALADVVRDFRDVEIVFPVHLNPAVRRCVDEELGGLPRVHLCDPLDYQPHVNLMARCHLVLTDSGGMQEEAPALGKPVLVLRESTERPEAVTAGTVRMVGTDRGKIFAETTRLLSEPAAYRAMAEAVNPYGDGLAAGRIVAALRYRFGLTDEPPGEFSTGR